MAAHAAPTPRRASAGRRGMSPGGNSPPAVGVSLLFGIAYGAYASFMARAGGSASFGQLWLALASGVGFAVLMYLIVSNGHAMGRELRAAVWGVFIGGSVGFLRALGDFSVWRSAGLGLAIGASVAVVTYYWWYTHEERGNTRST
jgi:hypothetical protein